MPVLYVSVNFYGHDKPDWSGRPAQEARRTREILTVPWLTMRRAHVLKAVGMDATAYAARAAGDQLWIQNFNAALGPNSEATCRDLVPTVMAAAGVARSKTLIMVTGYSSGGPSAIYFGRAVNGRGDAELIYVGLSDPAFYRGRATG